LLDRINYQLKLYTIVEHTFCKEVDGRKFNCSIWTGRCRAKENTPWNYMVTLTADRKSDGEEDDGGFIVALNSLKDTMEEQYEPTWTELKEALRSKIWHHNGYARTPLTQQIDNRSNLNQNRSTHHARIADNSILVQVSLELEYIIQCPVTRV
jgi:hypothetical protein